MSASPCIARSVLAIGSAILLGISTPLIAGGLIGDFVNILAPGVGTALDNAHHQIKNALPHYKALEESVSKSSVQTGAPIKWRRQQ